MSSELIRWHDTKSRYGSVLVGLSGILYGLMAFFGTKLFAYHLSVSNMLFWRFFVAAVCMLIRLPTYPGMNFTKYHLKKIVSGVLFYSVGSFFYFLAVPKIGTGLAMVVFFSYPITVTVCAYHKKEMYISSAKVIALLAIVVGLVLLKGQGSASLHYSGVVFGLIAAVGYGLYIFSNRHSAENMGADQFTLCICIGNAILFFILAKSSHTFFVPTNMTAWGYIVALGLAATAVPIQLLLTGMRYIDPIKTAILSVLEPIVTLFIGVLLLKESMSLAQALGVIIVLSSVLVVELDSKKT